MTSANDPVRAAEIAARRRKVAALRLRHLTHQEIAQMLPLEPNPIYNQETGRPFDRPTITRDLQAIEEEWRKETLEDLQVLKGKHLAELREVRRAAWQQGKLFYVLKSLEQEAEVLGLNELPDVPPGLNVFNFDFAGVPVERLKELDRLLDSIAGAPETITVDANGSSAIQGEIGPGDFSPG